MGFFQRLFNIGKAEAHSAIDKLEDPIKMTEQGIRDLKVDLDKSLHALAEVKSMFIRSKKEKVTYRNQANSYEKKAMQLLDAAENGRISFDEADRLASESLTKKEEAMQNLSRVSSECEKFESNVYKLDKNIKSLHSRINGYDNDLKTLKARSKVSDAMARVNKQVSKIDSSSTVAMLDRMKEKVEEKEALAEAYGDIADGNKSLDDEIDKALLDTDSSGSSALAALKARRSKKVSSPDITVKVDITKNDNIL